MPLVGDVVEKMEGRNEAKGSEANSEAAPRSEPAPRPQSVASSAAYSESAGTYSKRDKVEYYSETHREWLPANITDVDSKGRILMDVKPNTWISIEVQSEKVRPRKPAEAPAEAKAAKRPSTAEARRKSVPGNVGARPMSAREGRDAGPAERPPLARRRSAPGQRPSGPELPPRAKPAPGGVGVRRPSSGGSEAVGPKYRSPRGVGV